MASLQSHSSARGRRWWFLIAVAFLATGAIVTIRLQPEVERNFKNWMTTGVVVVTLALTLLWFLFLSRVAWRRRLVTLAVLALVAVGLRSTLKVDGSVNGTGFPQFAWRWTHSRTLRLEVPAASAAVEPATTSAAAAKIPDVPQFFGPDRTGIVQGAHLARDWSASPPKQLWRQPIGAGWSAFAVADGHAYTQEQRGEEEAITCYDLLTGKMLWAHTNPVHFYQWQGGDGPRATPTVFGGHLFAIGATGILDCLDAGTGKLVWSRDVLKENKLDNLVWGVSASPLVFEDTVIVTGGLTKTCTILAYRASSGEPLWQSGTDKASYASPILATLAGKRVVLSLNAGSLSAHDPATGERLLDFPWADDKWPKAAQPVVLSQDRVFVSAGYGIGCTLLEIKAGADGKLAATPLWKSLRMKTQFNSVALRDGFLYGLDDGQLACLDIATGDRKWKGGRYGSGQTLLVDDLVVVQSERGEVALAEAGPDAFKELGRIPALTAKTWNHPTLAGRYLLVRNSEEVACYELPIAGGERKTAER